MEGRSILIAVPPALSAKPADIFVTLPLVLREPFAHFFQLALG
jgi:hypothetical protein